MKRLVTPTLREKENNVSVLLPRCELLGPCPDFRVVRNDRPSLRRVQARQPLSIWGASFPQIGGQVEYLVMWLLE